MLKTIKLNDLNSRIARGALVERQPQILPALLKELLSIMVPADEKIDNQIAAQVNAIAFNDKANDAVNQIADQKVSEKIEAAAIDEKVEDAVQQQMSLLPADNPVGISKQEVMELVNEKIAEIPKPEIEEEDDDDEPPSPYHFKVQHNSRGQMDAIIATSDNDQDYHFKIDRNERKQITDVIATPVQDASSVEWL